MLDSAGHSFQTYLIMPIQRLPRYSLILRHFLQFEEDKHISESLQMNQKMTTEVNESIGNTSYHDLTSNVNTTDPIEQRILHYNVKKQKKRTNTWNNIQIPEVFKKNTIPKTNLEEPTTQSQPHSPRKRKSISDTKLDQLMKRKSIGFYFKKEDLKLPKEDSKTSPRIDMIKKRKSTDDIMNWLDFLEETQPGNKPVPVKHTPISKSFTKKEPSTPRKDSPSLTNLSKDNQKPQILVLDKKESTPPIEKPEEIIKVETLSLGELRKEETYKKKRKSQDDLLDWLSFIENTQPPTPPTSNLGSKTTFSSPTMSNNTTPSQTPKKGSPEVQTQEKPKRTLSQLILKGKLFKSNNQQNND